MVCDARAMHRYRDRRVDLGTKRVDLGEANFYANLKALQNATLPLIF